MMCVRVRALCAYGTEILCVWSDSCMLLGAIEGGGTKMVCAVGEEDGRIIDKISFPTRTPDETIPQIIDYFKDRMICALGLASFGPIDLDKSSPTYGYITTTTKSSWRNFNILETLKQGLNVPCGCDTDVNGSVLGEVTYGAMRHVQNGLYITIGTGVGTGIYINGTLVHGMQHPEGGHLLIRRHPEDDFKGICDYHGDCLEGLASGPAILARTGKRGDELTPDDKVWKFISYYIAQAICDYIFVISPQKIILGGGVMQQEFLFPMIREEVRKQMNGYISTKQMQDLDNYIVPASLHGDQAIMGCMKLAYDEAIRS